MRLPSKAKLDSDLKAIRKQMNDCVKLIQEDKISKDDYLLKIWPIARKRDILDIMQAMYDCKDRLSELSKSYFQLYTLGSPEEYFIKQINGENQTLASDKMEVHEELQFEVHAIIRKQHKFLENAIKRIRIPDSKKDIIDDYNTDNNNEIDN